MEDELLVWRFKEMAGSFKRQTYCGAQIKSFIQSLGMTYKEFAVILGVSEIKVKKMTSNVLKCDPVLYHMINSLTIKKGTD